MDKAEELLENPVTISAVLTPKDTIQDVAVITDHCARKDFMISTIFALRFWESL